MRKVSKMETALQKIEKVIKAIKGNKRYQIALYIALCVIIALGSRVQQASVDKQKYTLMMDERVAQISAEYEATIEQMKEDHYAEIVRIVNDYETLTPEDILREEGEYIAKVMYGTARNHSERDQRTLVWCILNRVDHASFPDTVQGVCQQNSQWIGYSDDNPVLEDLYDIATKELETWHNGYRPVTEDYVYMSWSSKEIVLRDTYNSTKTTRHWQAG